MKVSGAYGVSCGYSPFADDPVVKWRHLRLPVLIPIGERLWL
jgi:hypothetical protein